MSAESNPDIPLTPLRGEMAAMVAAEMIIGTCSADEVVRNALSLYALLAPEVRSGAEVTIARPAPDSKDKTGPSPIGRLGDLVANAIFGEASGPKTQLLRLSWEPPSPQGDLSAE